MSAVPDRSTAMFRPRALAEVLLRVWALTLLVRAFLNLPVVVMQSWVMREQSGEERVWTFITASTIVQFALTIIAGIAILKLAPEIAARLVRGNDEDDTPSPGSASWEALAFGLLGMYFLVEGLRSTALTLFQLITKPEYEMESMSYLWREAPEQLAGAIVMTVAGVMLFAGRKGIASLWTRARA